jgi:hypothetical protein
MADAAQLHILQHSLGVDKHGRGEQYRNHFVASEGHHDWADLLALVEAGLMTRRAGNQLSGGADVFYVTEAGKRHVAEHSPKPPKLTRSQQRYEDYLAEDSGLRFGEWLKSRRAA